LRTSPPFLRLASALLASILLMAGSIFAQESAEEIQPLTPAPSADSGEVIDETPQLWFVEMPSPPTADGSSLSTVRKEKNDFRAAARAAGLKYTERYAFDTLWNGLSIRINAGQLAKLASLPGVKNVYPVTTESLPPREQAEPDLSTALAMTGADTVQSSLGFTGRNVRVAVMDTGIDYNHADLGGTGVNDASLFPTARVITGYDFVGDDFNADSTSATYDPELHPDNYPDDCAGHGTHVAGIIGANGTVKGVAPAVVFGAYRVFGCEGSTTSDVMIAAMERILADKMQVLNMSIGSAFQWPQYPTAQAADRLVNKGIVVVASIGNSGANGLYSAGSPGLGAKVIGVASFDNTHITLPVFTISPDDTKIGYSAATGAPAPPTSGSFPMARTGTATSTADGCNALTAGSLAGKVALIRRGTCTFYVKSRNAQNAGAAAVVLYNNTAGRISPTVAAPTASDPAITIPVVAVSDTEGVLINNRLAADAVTMTWTSEVAKFTNSTGNLISSFSSYGLSPDLALKPDIGAPGGFIYSTYPLELGGYATLSGTSMASPHTAGAVALLLQAKPKTSAQAARSILQNNAEPKVWWGNPGLGFLDNVHRQGAGMLKIDRAILATSSVDPAKLALGESEAGPATRTLTIKNNLSSSVTYALSQVPSLSTGNNTFTPSFSTGFASVAFSIAGAPVSSVVVPARGTATVDVTITANAALAARSQYGGYLVLTPDTGAVVRVPYAGLKGDYQSMAVMNGTLAGYPRLASWNGSGFVPVGSGGATFTMKDDDLAYIQLHLHHQVRRLRFEVVDLSGNSWHRAFEANYVGRNSTTGGTFTIGWDGTTSFGNQMLMVPNGQYKVVVTILKALGDETNPGHVETWESPTITVARP
jgi:minor extracellular serine protease Vpr